MLDIINATDESITETYEQMARDENYVTFVAQTQGKVIGLVTAVKVLAIGHPGSYVKMNGLGVISEYRRRGIGKLLMERAESWAAQQGAPYVGLASGIRRTDAHAFYERIGYSKTSFWFRRNIKITADTLPLPGSLYCGQNAYARRAIRCSMR